MKPGAAPELLADPALHADLRRFVRGRVPHPDVDDVVQATLADAAAASAVARDEPENFRRWVFGVARNKAYDLHRRRGRELSMDPTSIDDLAADGDTHESHDLWRWIERELPKKSEAAETLQWMLREGSGEKLEHIALEARLPATRVRKRVSRLRRHLRSRWAAQAAATLALLGAIALVFGVMRKRANPPQSLPAPLITTEVGAIKPPENVEEANRLRGKAYSQCKAFEYTKCLETLDQAAKLDPAGEGDPDVQAARAAAIEALKAGPQELPPPPPKSDKPRPE